MARDKRLAEFLQGLEFPATRARLIGYAIGWNAPSEVVEQLTRLPDRQYSSLGSVWEALDPEMG